MIVYPKERYTNKLSKKSDDLFTVPKAYFSIVNAKKILNISPINVNGKIISNLKKKAELFNSRFAFQWTQIDNSSVL